MKDTSAYEQCTAYFEEHRCERPAGHSKKHRGGGVTWTDDGAVSYTHLDVYKRQLPGSTHLHLVHLQTVPLVSPFLRAFSFRPYTSWLPCSG